MAVRTVVEVAVHFESFRNIDLFHQGLYHLRSRIYRDVNGRKIVAEPYNYFACSTKVAEDVQKDRKSARTDHHHLIPAHVIEDQCTFCTRSFLIRYCEEEVELDDMAQFRVEIGLDEVDDEEAPLFLEVELMFGDLTRHGGADRFGEAPADVESMEFKCVSTQLFKLHKAESGLHEFCPVVFDEFHFCLAGILVHSALLDVRFRVRPVDLVLSRQRLRGDESTGEADTAAAMAAAPFVVTPSTASTARPSEAPTAAAAARAAALAGGVAAGTRGAVDGSAAAATAPLGQPTSALTCAERYFKGVEGLGSERLLDIAEGLYKTHMGALADSYARQSEWFQTICSRCLTQSQREAMDDALDLPDLCLPGGIETAPLQHPSARGGNSSGSFGSSTERRPVQTTGALRRGLIKRLGQDFTAKQLAAYLSYDFNQVACQVVELWQKVLNVMSIACKEIVAFLRVSWEEAIIDHWSTTVLHEVVSGDIACPEDQSIGDLHDIAALRLRRTTTAKPPPKVEHLSLLPSLEERPIMFEQRYMPKPPAGSGYAELPPLLDGRLPSAPKNYRGVHLFVLVHGFQGNSFDMRLMKNNIALLYPDAVFLCSNSNEDNTEGDFTEMGIRLAQEVVNYICDWCPGSTLGRLSFLAHSIGGLIVRSALPLLHEYTSKMFTFLTFSSPHAGYFLKNISLFHMGLKVLQSWRKSMCLAQLSMADAADPRETFLYKLSKIAGFEHFENIVLMSCPSDQYSPFDSARVEIGGMLDKHSHKDVYCSMVRNMWEHVEPRKVFRFDVNFHIPENNLDSFIGRTAHILFLENQAIMKMIIHNYSFLFR